MRLLARKEILNAARNGRILRLARRHQPQKRPGGLRRIRHLALALRPVRPIGRAILAPAAILPLFRQQPGDGAANRRVARIDTRRVERAEYRPGAVDVIGAPAAEPRAFLRLHAPQIIEPRRQGRFMRAVAELRQERHAARGDILGRRIEQRAVIGVGDVVQVIIFIVGVEGRPAAVAALHADQPFSRALDGIGVALVTGAVQRHRHHRRIVEIGIMRVEILERPAAGPDIRPPHRPIAREIELLARHQPIEPLPRQELDLAGDWAVWRPNVRPGGWAFQYLNPHYPDLDDTAVVAMALHRAGGDGYRNAVERATEWLVGMQCRNGRWAAFDADNEYYYLNYIPYADHGALLDPPTEDVTARCVSLLAQLGDRTHKSSLAAGLDYLRRMQTKEGAWFGRWGTNYIYGTWSVLCALNAAGVDSGDAAIRRAVAWLLSKQRDDGGWGEDGASYWPNRPRGEGKVSNSSQTAWALLGLMAAGEAENPAVSRGVKYLLASQQAHGLWDEESYTAVGFPRVFYLRYHGYRAYFPLWALARYRNLRQATRGSVVYGM